MKPPFPLTATLSPARPAVKRAVVGESSEYRYAEGSLNRTPDLAADLVRLNVEVIVAETTIDALAAKALGITISPAIMVQATRVIQQRAANVR